MASSDAACLPDDALVELQGLVGSVLRGDHDGRGLRLGFACGLFNGGISWRLLRGALEGATECGIDPRDITVAWAPGAFELPLLARSFAMAGAVDAVVCLGAVIRGETGHYDFVAGGCATGIQQVQVETGVPVVFGVLTTENLDQALSRSAPDHENKGRESVMAAVEMVRLLRGAPQLGSRGSGAEGTARRAATAR
jgi:6,7-dimethyl-8-ribityllumazine synthase